MQSSLSLVVLASFVFTSPILPAAAGLGEVISGAHAVEAAAVAESVAHIHPKAVTAASESAVSKVARADADLVSAQKAAKRAAEDAEWEINYQAEQAAARTKHLAEEAEKTRKAHANARFPNFWSYNPDHPNFNRQGTKY